MKKFSVIRKEVNDYLNKKTFLGKPLDDVLAKTILGVILVLVIVVMLPSERPFEYSNLTVGSIARSEIIAPFTFPIIKSKDVLAREREQARLSVPPVYDHQSNAVEVQDLKLKKLFEELTVFFGKIMRDVKTQNLEKDKLPREAKVDSLIQQIFVKYNVSLTFENVNQLFELYRTKQLSLFHKNLTDAFSRVYSSGIINVPKDRIEEKKLIIIRNGVEEETDVDQVMDLQEAKKTISDILSRKYPATSAEVQLAPMIVSAFLTPDLIYNQEITTTRKDKAIHEVPTTSGFVHKDERIVDSHEIITEDIYLKLQSLAEALKERSGLQRGWHHFLFYVGEYIFALLIIFIFGIYVYYYRPGFFADNKMLGLITTILIIQFLLAMLIDGVLKWNFLSIPVTLGPMLLSMLLDAPVAFLGTVVISFVLGAAQGNNFYLALVTLVVGTIALLSVQKIRNRGQMFRAILYILIGYSILSFSYGFIHYDSFSSMLQNLGFYMLPNAILVPTAVFLLIGIFEKLFDVSTDITLLELSDLNHPLLKRLSVEAPGTFHHSIIVGNLAEAAAKAIGANSLLARVGCYYHDVGKMQRAEYFVENQAGAMNKHEKLTPTMSSLILAKHVKAGLELADEYGLPRAVKQFIPEHHGTNLMAYFYHKATETMDPKDINENDFRYPGPKPQSKETAISMLADAVEAASRALPNPNLQRISSLVEDLIEKRFQEGQLDECDVTLRELNEIKQAFIPILMGIHHLRIEYPGSEPKGEKGRQSGSEKQEAEGKITPQKSRKGGAKSPASADEASGREKQASGGVEKDKDDKKESEHTPAQ